MNRRWLWCGILSLSALAAPAAEPAVRPDGGAAAVRGAARPHGFAANAGAKARTAEMTPEEKARFEAARKRRFEIMVLMESYKIMPEQERAALKRELLKRIEADLRITLDEKKRKLAAAEQELETMRADIARREKNAGELAEKEMERLLRLPAPWRRGRPRMDHPNGGAARPAPAK